MHRSICKVLFLVGAVVLASGCFRNAALVRFEREHECKEDVAVKNLGAYAYRVSGCGRTVTYVCQNRVCITESESEAPASNSGEDAISMPVHSNVPTRNYDHVRDGVTSSQASSGVRVITAQFGNQSLSMHVQSTPKNEDRKVWLGMRVWNMKGTHKSCPLQLMVNGELLTLDPPRYRHERGYEELHVQLAYEQLYTVAEGPRVVGRICDDEFRLSDEHVLILRELVSRIYEELSFANLLTPEDRARVNKEKGATETSEGASAPREL